MQRTRFAILACACFIGLTAQAFSQTVTPPPFEILRSFDRPPVMPLAGLAESEGALYGAALKGGHFDRGALFQLVLPSADTQARVEKVYSWSDADFEAERGPALGTPLAASDGHLYGVAGRGAGSSGWIYRTSPAGDVTVLHSLDPGQDGIPAEFGPSYTAAPLVESGDWLYGTLYGGGGAAAGGEGTVFRIHRTLGTFERLHAFTGGTDGGHPLAGLVERDGWFYGTTMTGGVNSGGTLFRIDAEGDLDTLRQFDASSDGAYPAAELVVGPDGLLYGALRGGGPRGCGSVFRFDPDAPLDFQPLASFACDGTTGSYPEGGMVVLDNGGASVLFGVAPAWTSPDVGAIYRISLDENPAFEVLETLPGSASCSSRLLHASDGQIYGQCYGDHGSNGGRVFQIDPAGGRVTTVFAFGVDAAGGHTPYALVEGPGGAIYGTTRRGGPANRGSLFRLSWGGEFEVVHAFTDSGKQHEFADPRYGNPPVYAATFLTHAADGLVYGARCDGGANGTGSLFRLDPALDSYETLYSAGPDYDRTACPHGPLVESSLSPGTFFGTAMGSENFLGSAFRFDSGTKQVSVLWDYGDHEMRTFTRPVGRVALGADDEVYASYTTTQMWVSSHYGGGVVEAAPTGGIVAREAEPRVVDGPIAGLVRGSSDPDEGLVLYGSSTGAGPEGRGNLFWVSVSTAGGPLALGLLHSFTGVDGANPTAELAFGPGNTYYGSTARGGTHEYGTLFAMEATEPVTTVTPIHHFDDTNGAYPETQLVAGSDGNLYGTTSRGGPGGGGVIFRVNLAPRVALEGPASTPEGETLTFTALAGDAQGDTLTFAWEIDGASLDDEQDDTVLLTAPDGDGEFAVSVRVTDPTGLVAEDSISVAVTNVAPTATFAAAPTTVMPGEPFTLSFADPADPSAADVAAGLRYGYDCDGDGTYDVLESPEPTHSCTYEPAGTHVARGRIEDKDGGYAEYTVQVVPPPLEGIDLLIDQVNDLVAEGDLSPSAAKHLLQELEQARKHLGEGQPGPTVNQLLHFIRTVEDLVSSGELDAADGQPLIDEANRIIAQLGG